VGRGMEGFEGLVRGGDVVCAYGWVDYRWKWRYTPGMFHEA
jgi:hypothetical protein